MGSGRKEKKSTQKVIMYANHSSRTFSDKIGAYINTSKKIGVRKRNIQAYIWLGVVIIFCLIIAYMDSIQWNI